MKQNIKKIAVSAGIALAFIAYIFYQKGSGSGNLAAPSKTPIDTSSGNQTAVHYKDGEYTGDVTDAFYGNLQVKAVIRGGKIADVLFLQYPNDRETSIEINKQAMPMLKTEAIAAQSAEVDIVSGATQTSEAFIGSLKSALLQAKA